MPIAPRRRTIRLAAVLVAGGVVMQLAGCAAGLAPVFLSFVESTVLRALLSPIAFP